MAHRLRALRKDPYTGVGRRHAHYSTVAKKVGRAVQGQPLYPGQRGLNLGTHCPQCVERKQVRPRNPCCRSLVL